MRNLLVGERLPRVEQQYVAFARWELVEQFRSNVLPMFTTRNIDNRTTCVPHQNSGSVINLKFESFAAPPGRPRTAQSQQGAS